MSKQRILIIENSIAITGALNSIIRSCQGLSMNYDFFFVLPKGSKAVRQVQDSGFAVSELPMRELRRNVASTISYLPALLYNVKRLGDLIKALNIDLIVVNDFYNLLPPVYQMLGGTLPYVCYVRFLPSKFPKPLVKVWCKLHHRYAYTTVAVSQAVKRELKYQQKVAVIGNELPGPEVNFTPPPANNTILYPANYIRGKGQEYALQSWATISHQYPQWKLRFVGSNMGLAKNAEFKNELAALAEDLKIADAVEWRDFSEKISDEYLTASFVLNFSESESFSMTCLEAMFYGRAVIATRSGGPAEIIEHNISGILVELKDVTAMANAMELLITNSEKREEMARQAYESVRIKFSFANTIAKVGDIYRQALNNSSSHTS
jgi:glycosyltransferase involved in cell wall biosynthesis